MAAAAAWALLVPVADWLAGSDVGSAAGSLHETAVDNARGRLLTLGAGLGAAGALIFTGRNFFLSRGGQVADRYTKAIEQLGSDKLDVRLGGIYALERIARDSRRDHPTVMEVLTAFIRVHSHDPWPPPADRISKAKTVPARPDVQAALTVIGRRKAGFDTQPVDLTRANLARVILIRANLARASLYRADLGGAELREVDLTGATLTAANFLGATVRESNFSGATLTGVKWPRDSSTPIPKGWTRNGPDSRLRRDHHQLPVPDHSGGG